MEKRLLHGRTARVLFLAAIAAPFVPVAPASALPAGWFHLRGTVKDATAPFALRSMDVKWPPDANINGFVRLNATGSPRDSQLWKATFPRTGVIGQVKLRNKLTDQCISRNTAVASGLGHGSVLAPCSRDNETIWESLPRGGGKAIFRYASRGFHYCLSKTSEGNNRELLGVENCSDGFTPGMVWEAYKSG